MSVKSAQRLDHALVCRRGQATIADGRLLWGAHCPEPSTRNITVSKASWACYARRVSTVMRFHVEQRESGAKKPAWRHLGDDFYHGQDYDLFSLLAGVRGRRVDAFPDGISR